MNFIDEQEGRMAVQRHVKRRHGPLPLSHLGLDSSTELLIGPKMRSIA